MIHKIPLSKIILLYLLSTSPLLAVRPDLSHDAKYFVNPEYWTMNDPNALDDYITYQQWDVFSNVPNHPTETHAYIVKPLGLALPTLLPEYPGFFSSSGFYALGGDYAINADIYNHTTAPTNLGTHVIVQIACTKSRDGTIEDPNTPLGIFVNSIKCMTHDNQPINGGANIDALRVDDIASYINYEIYGGLLIIVQEVIAEFYLPNYRGDIRIHSDIKNHGAVLQVRVDTCLTPNAMPITPIPGPYDINDDNMVDLSDLALFINNFGHDACVGFEGCGGSDFNIDSNVDLIDFLLLSTKWLIGVHIQ